ncbi:MAG TPA: single-stranded-DNA-specific exonuclease RecJ [Phototrophicaceae bacterium]|nr:single-stranded-DNA-specific exonuclease RecJ [Phototrophicaceae bacterium]
MGYSLESMPPAPRKRWLVREADPPAVARHSEQLKVPPLLARILILRGYPDGQSAKRYLSSSLREDLPSPFDMIDMEPAVVRLVRAIEDKEQIGIWGDYDVDGTTGASLLVCFLRAVGAQPIYYVPHRIEEGYGLNTAGLRRLKERGVGLIVTVDCGISNAIEIEAAREFGLEIIVIDHHQPPPELPRALAVVNPHRKDCPFPDKGLCAAGLAFYVVIGLRAKLREGGWFPNGALDIRPYLDIVTLGTIADMVPLRGVNRTLLRRGLQELSSSSRPGVVALKKVAGIPDGDVSAGQVGFRLGPRINAAGRVDYGIKVVELLTTESSEIAARIAQELEAHNSERRAVEAAVLEQALTRAAAVMDGGSCHSLVLAGDGWHAGVLGIVASRIVEKYCRPTVVIGFEGDQGKGSARSIRGFHLVQGFQHCAEHLEKFGGHEYAGGLSIKAAKLVRFADEFEKFARQALMPEDLLPLLEIDAELQFAEIDLGLLRGLNVLKPFGIGNPEPLFMTSGAEICERRTFSSGVRYRLRQAGRAISSVMFGVPDELPGAPGELIDIAYRLTENEWNGTSAPELRLADLRTSENVSASSEDRVLR